MITLLSAISLGGLLNVVLYLVVAALIIWLLLWALGQIGLPDPFAKIIRVLIIVIGVIIVINILLGLVGHGFIDL